MGLPCVYVLVGRRLRCYAARGYFQVVDGFVPGEGVIGCAVASGQTVVVNDVSQDPAFVAAVPGLQGEACVPATIGVPVESLTQRTARVVVELTGLSELADIERRAVTAAAELSGMSTSVLARRLTRDLVVTAGTGPLNDAMAGLSSADLMVMERWVASGTSSHFPGGDDVPPAYEFLSCAGIRSLSVYPMQAGGRHTGLLAIADADPRPHEPDVVEALELLAAQTATSIGTAESMDDLRRRVAQDPLTGCGNAAAPSARSCGVRTASTGSAETSAR